MNFRHAMRAFNIGCQTVGAGEGASQHILTNIL